MPPSTVCACAGSANKHIDILRPSPSREGRYLTLNTKNEPNYSFSCPSRIGPVCCQCRRNSPRTLRAGHRPAHHQPRLRQCRRPLQTHPGCLQRQCASRYLATSAMLLRHRSAFRNRFTPNRCEIPPHIQHAHDTHGRHRAQRHRPLHLGRRLGVAARQHQPSIRQGQRSQNHRSDLCRKSRR